MGKTRKTLRQKKLADRHTKQHPSPSSSNSPFTYTLTTPTTSVSQARSKVIVPDIKHDLIKTLVLTGAITIAELLLFFVL